MAAHNVSAGKRGPGSAWSRLRTPVIDPLEAYGLPSKGETRLNDAKAQENYYNKIVERYMKFCGDAGRGDELDKRFAALSLAHSKTSMLSSSSRPEDTGTTRSLDAAGKGSAGLSSSKYATTTKQTTVSDTPLPPSSIPRPQKSDLTTATPSQELSVILSAMRKLRESITATHRHDTFAQRCYIFIIRACILTRSWESYHPALLYLLGTIHSRTPLSQSELKEFVSYRVLDEACRTGDLAEAQRQRLLWRRRTHGKVDELRVATIVSALIHDDWHQFWRLRRAVDGYQRALMGWTEESVRLHALKCLGKSYFSAEKQYIERCAGAGWEALINMGVGWELQANGETVTIRKPKPRGTGTSTTTASEV